MIERNHHSKVFSRHSSVGQSWMSKLKIEDVGTASTRAEIFGKVAKFYGQLYISVDQSLRSSAEDRRAELNRHYTEDVPDISLQEILIALGELQSNKAPEQQQELAVHYCSEASPPGFSSTALKYACMTFSFILGVHLMRRTPPAAGAEC
ncbi:unnamed protein product [Euphydryas editha]|uniref:Uncharacterized protein n=1 Tax=Euphydryas editha TaxID=104508 RepID=A0AAU9TFD0_EUPED|nr:unnamed protein product [Euphydryas editha]